MATNVASAAVDRRADSEVDLLAIPQASEASLNQPHCMSTNMRATAQAALNASITVGSGPDQYDGDGVQQ